jgi:hypothetical protein
MPMPAPGPQSATAEHGLRGMAATPTARAAAWCQHKAGTDSGEMLADHPPSVVARATPIDPASSRMLCENACGRWSTL